MPRLGFTALVFGVLCLVPHSARADGFQFGVIFTSTLAYPGPIPSGNGAGAGAFVIANLGTVPIDPFDISASLTLGPNDLPGAAVLSVFNDFAPVTLNPGQAAVLFQDVTPSELALVRSFFPGITSLVGDQGTFNFEIMNPVGSGVEWDNTSSQLLFDLDLAGADALFTTTFTTVSAQIGTQSTVVLGAEASTISTNPYTPTPGEPPPVSEPDCFSLLACGVLALFATCAWSRTKLF